jgi:hypothetical protein
MLAKSDLRIILTRLGISFVAALVLVLTITELAYLFQDDRADRTPQTIELVIPPGTADRIAAGSESPTLPDEMNFLVGDVLLVVNQDEVDHQLGPVWVPPGTSASLALDQADNYAYSCSFQVSRYLDLNVRLPTTLKTRLTGLSLAVPPTTMMFLVYSFVIFPTEGRKKRTDGPLNAAAGDAPLSNEGRS